MIRVLVSALVIALALSSSVGAQDVPRAQTLILGKVSGNPKKQFPKLEALAVHLAARLKDKGIEKGGVLIAQSNAEMIALLKDGKVDLVTETPLSALLIQEKSGAEIFLLEWKGGAPTYQSLLFTTKESPVKSLADLRGRKVVFQDPGSTSGFLLPLSMLLRAGLSVVELSSPRETPPANKVGYVFADAEANTLAWVVNGLVDAGTLSNMDLQSFAETQAPVVDKIRVFAESAPFPRSTLMAGPNLDPTLREAVTSVLTGLHETEAGKAVMEEYFKVARFESLTPTTAEEFEEVRTVFGLIRDRME